MKKLKEKDIWKVKDLLKKQAIKPLTIYWFDRKFPFLHRDKVVDVFSYLSEGYSRGFDKVIYQ